MLKKIYYLIEKPLLIIGSLASILSIILLCFNNLLASMIAVSCLCVALCVLVYALLQAIFKYTRHANNGEYRRIATFIEYKTVNKDIIEFQTYRIIQVKTPILKSIDFIYHWTGDQSPEVKSDLQELEFVTDKTDRPNGYSKARLSLHHPKLYNETAVFHHKLIANDPNHKSVPKVEVKIEDPIDLVRINISLGYKPSDCNETAKVERSAITHDAPPQYEHVAFIPFDKTLKEYIFTLQHPEPGYFYRISWER